MIGDRTNIIEFIEQSQEQGARLSEACDLLGFSVRTLQRWKSSDTQEDGRITVTGSPGNKLTELERHRVIQVAHEPAYAHLSPQNIVPALADKGIYIASEATFYRILKEVNQLKHRLNSKPARTVNRPKALIATQSNQIYSWDITYLPTLVSGLFFYLYMVIDIFSRKIVGWQVYQNETSALAADLITDICCIEGIARHQVTLHSDNGSPMKGAAMLATLQQLGVMPSFSRPSVSNDNPYSESLFRTLKYRPEYPERAFESLASAREWVEGFVQWYNFKHLHSSINFVTPQQRHSGEDTAILAQRHKVYMAAKAKHPERWSKQTRNWNPITEVYLNPEKQKVEIIVNKVA